ncbi:MAG: redoxin domain-containing protein [Balneolales bacterium]
MSYSYTGILLFCITLISTTSSESQIRLEIGKKAPDFVLKDVSGKSHALSDYENNFVVLEWLNHDCPFVSKHYNSGNMQKLQEYYRDLGVIWLSILSSAPGSPGHLTPEQARTITREHRARPHGVLLDQEGKVRRAYDARVTPQMYIINPYGVLEYMGAIDNRPTDNPADIDRARNFVNEALHNLLNGLPVEVTIYQPYGCPVVTP